MGTRIVFLVAIVCLFLVSPTATSQEQKSKPPNASKWSTPDSIPLEIKGDRIGESFEYFKTHYPQAECHDESREVRFCFQKTDISLASHSVTPCPKSPIELFLLNVCMHEGLIAGFHKNNLHVLSYTFRTLDETEDLARTCAAFQTKYGKPDLNSETECSWNRKNSSGEIEQELSIEVSKLDIPYAVHSGDIEYKRVFFLEAVLRDPRPSKDI
jgi:hypothetical protein